MSYPSAICKAPDVYKALYRWWFQLFLNNNFIPGEDEPNLRSAYFSDVGFSTPTSFLGWAMCEPSPKTNQKCHPLFSATTFLAGWRRPLTCVNCWGVEGLLQLTIVQGPVVLGRLVVWIHKGSPKMKGIVIWGNSRFEVPKPPGPKPSVDLVEL